MTKPTATGATVGLVKVCAAVALWGHVGGRPRFTFGHVYCRRPTLSPHLIVSTAAKVSRTNANILLTRTRHPVRDHHTLEERGRAGRQIAGAATGNSTRSVPRLLTMERGVTGAARVLVLVGVLADMIDSVAAGEIHFGHLHWSRVGWVTGEANVC